MWYFLGGKSVGNDASFLLQIHEEEVRRRAKNFPDVATASSFSEERLPRKQNRDAVFDCRNSPCDYFVCNLEGSVKGRGTIAQDFSG